jgi:hypothetical protein
MLHHRHEERVHPVVVSQFWMKGRGKQVPLPNHDNPTVVTLAHGGQDLDGRADSLYPRSPDEDSPKSVVAQFGDLKVCLEGRDLSTEGVAPDGDVDSADRFLVGTAVEHLVGQHDHAGTRAVDRKAAGYDIAQGLQQVVALGEHVHRRRLTARNDEPIEPAQFLGTSDFNGVSTDAFKGRSVFPNVTLQGENADERSARGHQPRSSSLW